jgi:C4-dicarboxylate-specific signal transduction histidine kinase
VDAVARGVAGAKETGLLDAHEVRWRPPDGSKDWSTPSEQDLLSQMFVNLLINAAESMRKPGIIAVSLQKSEFGYVVRIVDEGVGLSPDAGDRIFTPLYSAKATGRGIGLGLTVAQRIVQRHGGRLHLTAAATVGTAAIVELADSSR